MTFAVLFVCTGNLCRSAAAEQMLAFRLRSTPGVELMSAGTRATAGEALHPLTTQALEAAGYPLTGHSAQRLVPEMVAVADLVLTATRAHRVPVVESDPSAARRTFTMLEFARLLRRVDRLPASASELVDLVAAVRSQSPATAADDVEDPVRGGAGDHERMVAAVSEPVDVIARALLRMQDHRPDAPGGRRTALRTG